LLDDVRPSGGERRGTAQRGVGIDENTAILVEGPTDALRFQVIGAGAVYVADGSAATYTNVSDEARDRALSLFGVRLHVLSQGDEFDITSRTPTNHPAERVDETLGVA
jgi:cyanophycinase